MAVRVGRTIVIAFALALCGSACADEATLPADADPELILGHRIYGDRCARCHGADGGGGIGPNLQDVGSRLTDEQQRDIILNGRKAMPRFDQVLSDVEIDAVVRFSREIL